LIRYSRDFGFYQDFLDRGLLLTRKLLNRGFLVIKLKSLLRKCWGLHQVTDTFYRIMLYWVHLAGIELSTLVVISTYCIGSCKSSYHTITVTYLNYMKEMYIVHPKRQSYYLYLYVSHDWYKRQQPLIPNRSVLIKHDNRQ
jgi:hypothetical protein